MDKSGSVAKNIVAAPTFDPVREVEYGCGKSTVICNGWDLTWW